MKLYKPAYPVATLPGLVRGRRPLQSPTPQAGPERHSAATSRTFGRLAAFKTGGRKRSVGGEARQMDSCEGVGVGAG